MKHSSYRVAYATAPTGGTATLKLMDASTNDSGLSGLTPVVGSALSFTSPTHWQNSLGSNICLTRNETDGNCK